MHREHELDVASTGEPADGAADAAHCLAVALSTMQREQDPPWSGGRHRRPQEACACDRPEQGVDHRVPGHQHPVHGHALGEQVLRVPGGGTEVQSRQPGDESSVRLFRERGPLVACAEPGLHVRYRDALIEACESATQGGGRVALDEHPIRAERGDRSADPAHELSRQVGEALLRGHDVEVDVGLELELLEHLVEHLPVLAGRHHDALGATPSAQLGHNRRKLDHLGAGTEDGDHSHGGAPSRARRRVFAHAVRPRTRCDQATSDAIAHR